MMQEKEAEKKTTSWHSWPVNSFLLLHRVQALLPVSPWGQMTISVTVMYECWLVYCNFLSSALRPRNGNNLSGRVQVWQRGLRNDVWEALSKVALCQPSQKHIWVFEIWKLMELGWIEANFMRIKTNHKVASLHLLFPGYLTDNKT